MKVNELNKLLENLSVKGLGEEEITIDAETCCWEVTDVVYSSKEVGIIILSEEDC